MDRHNPGPGRSEDVGADVQDGRHTDLGGSTSGGDASDAHAVGDAKAVHTGDTPISEEDARNADVPREGTPEDLELGKRRTVGMDEDAGAGNPDTTGTPGSTSGG